jgi:hypothetical protein
MTGNCTGSQAVHPRNGRPNYWTIGNIFETSAWSPGVTLELTDDRDFCICPAGGPVSGVYSFYYPNASLGIDLVQPRAPQDAFAPMPRQRGYAGSAHLHRKRPNR